MFVLLAAISVAAIAFFYSQGCLLWLGDAMSHLNIARRIIDSRTPGWEQIGTVWLPLPHLLMLPFVGSDHLWQTGLAGSIPSGICFVLGGLFLFLAARRAFASGWAGLAACLLVALNPNFLFLQSIAMTEAALLLSLAAALYFSVLFQQTQSLWAAAGAGVAVLAGTLTRYEGWFLIPFVAVYFLFVAEKRRLVAPIIFGLIASIGPLWWLAHNLWYYGNPLEFYNGPYSAKAIYGRALAAGMARYPGDHEWAKALLYYRTAMSLTAGWALIWLAVAGAVGAAIRKVFWPLILLALPPVFYIWSLYSSGTPIFVPTLWPHSYYNTRYALAALPFLAMAAAGLVALVPERFRALAAGVVVIAGVSCWVAFPRMDNWVCWKESQVNNQVRMVWTREAARYLRENVRPGDTIFTSFGELTAIYEEAAIPLHRTLHNGNGPLWQAAVNRPDLFLWEEWAVAVSGDPISTAILRARKSGPRYDCVKTIAMKGAPVIEIYRRSQ